MENVVTKDTAPLRFAAVLLRAYWFLGTAFPLLPFVSFASFVGRCLFPFFRKERRIAEAQLRYVVARRGLEAERLRRDTEVAAGAFAHAGESIAEVFVIRRLIEQNVVHHVSIEAEKQFHEFFRGPDGTGVLALSGHIGCFELLAASHAARQVPVTVVGRLPNYRGIADLLMRVRNGYGVKTIWREDPSGARKLFSTLRQGGVLAVLLDQDTDLESAFPSFFDLPAASPVAPIRLALKLKVPMITTFIVRVDRLKHEVHTEVLDYQSFQAPDQETLERLILEEYSRRLERLILQYPEQWLWWHRRWRREPGVDYTKEPMRLKGTREYLDWLQKKESQ